MRLPFDPNQQSQLDAVAAVTNVAGATAAPSP